MEKGRKELGVDMGNSAAANVCSSEFQGGIDVWFEVGRRKRCQRHWGAECTVTEGFDDERGVWRLLVEFLTRKKRLLQLTSLGHTSEIAMQYETRGQDETAISLLKRTLSMLREAPTRTARRRRIFC
ncbi:hypothetical protein NC651_004681 [Populus alba x Populus x berolinensis]|nr:hypothetical protein NC651_004681 [Populus alba x Populus x berolinensis]